MTCLAFDQSTDWTGVAVVRGSAVGHREVLDGATVRSRKYHELHYELAEAEVLNAVFDFVAYEAPYIHPSGKRSPQPAFQLMRVAGWIEALIYEHIGSARFLSATARVWREAAWEPGAGSWTREIAKDYALAYARAFDVVDPTEHLGDAIGIGNWAITEFLKGKEG